MRELGRGDETRRRILESIQETPGLNKLQVQRQVGIGWGTTIYNLEVLANQGLVRFMEDRGHVRIFDASLSTEEMRFRCGMLHEHSEKIVSQLDEHGFVQAFEVADALGLSRKVIRRALSHMHKAGVVERKGARHVFYRISAQARRLVRRE